MRCLQCGSQLALLKKLTDGEFCSADHRTLFYDTQQKLIIERLADSARKLKRYRAVAAPREAFEPAPLVEKVAPVKPSEQVPAFAQRVPVPVLETLAFRNFPYKPAPGFAAAEMELELRSPSFQRVKRKKKIILAAAVPTFLGAQSTSRRRKRLEINPGALSSPRILLPQLPSLGRVPNQAQCRPGHLVGFTQWNLASADSVANDRNGVEATPSGSAPSIPGFAEQSLPYGGLPGAHALRMRPRAPVQDTSIERFETITADFMPASADAGVSPNYPSPEIELHGPVFSSRFLRARPRGPVSTPDLLEIEKIEPGAGSFTTAVSRIPELAKADAKELAPTALNRFFLTRSRGAVQTRAGESGGGMAETDAEVFAATPALPGYPVRSAGDCAPLFLDRGFRMRPRAGVASAGIVDFEPQAAQAIDTTAVVPSKPSLPSSIFGEYAPVLVERGFRPRPRGPVACDGLAEYERISSGLPDSLGSSPVLAGLPPAVIGETSPNLARRFFRMGLKGPVAFSTREAFAGTDESDRSALLSPPALACLPPSILGSFSPIRVDRFFRARPRGPVETLRPVHSEPIATGLAADLLSTPALGTLPGYVIGDCAPIPMVRFFRPRPRGPLDVSSPAATEPIPAGIAQELKSAPALGSLPVYLIGECAPSRQDRFFRARPRGPVDVSSPAAIELIPAGTAAELKSTPALGSLPVYLIGECAPSRQDRFFRARPRGPVVDAALAGMERIGTGLASELISNPFRGSLPSYAIGECAPNSMVRFFRGRPRAAAESQLSGNRQIATGSHADLLSTPWKSRSALKIIGEYAPNPVVRFFRARPRGPLDSVGPVLDRIASGAAELLLSKPAMASLPTLNLAKCSPDPVQRFFRPRPRGPVTASVAEWTGNCGSLLFDPVAAMTLANLPRITPGVLEPAFVNRPFRMRMRAGVIANDLASFNAIGCGLVEPLCSAPAPPALPEDTIACPVPSHVDKPFRMRPRGPVASSQSATFLPVEVGSPAALSGICRIPSISVLCSWAFEPAFLDRFYRMRPRGPVQLGIAQLESLSAGTPETLTPRAAMPSMPAILMRQARPAMRDRGGPRLRPPGPQSGSGTRNFEQPEETETETRVPQASREALADGILSDSAMPTSARLFRSRPRGASSLSAAPRFEQISSGSTAEVHLGRPVQFQDLMTAPVVSDLRPMATAGVSAMCPPGAGFVMRSLVEAAEWQRPALSIGFTASQSSRPDHFCKTAPITTAALMIPAQPAGFRPSVTPVEADPVIASPALEAEPIVDYRPSLIEVRRAYQLTHKPGLLETLSALWNVTSWELKWALAVAPFLLAGITHYAINLGGLARSDRGDDKAALASNPLPTLSGMLSSSLPSLRNGLQGRAAVDFREDFTGPLSAWQGEKDWSESWNRDNRGGIRPGVLALYTASLGMSDYLIEFTGEIEKKSLGWVVRAADTRNYYSMKLVTLKPGPLPVVAVVRSTVVDGREGPVTQTILPFPVTGDQVYRVRMQVEGQFFTIFVQDRVVDFWTDSRLAVGGAGFFSGEGEQSRLAAFRISHQNDAMGRLCASLALQEKRAK